MLRFLGAASVVVIGLWARAEPVARPEVERTLTRMSAAALAGDTDAYLLQVSRADPEFYNEQVYFAKDLKKKPPASLTVSVGDLSEAGDSAEGEVTWEWSMPEKKTRTLTFKARFVREEGAWRYAGETWRVFEAPGLKVMHDEGLDELAKRTAEAFQAVRAGVEEEFGLKDSHLSAHTQQIKIYGSMKHLQGSICLSYETGLSGWNEPGEPIKLLANHRTTARQLQRVLAHEYGHCATFALGAKANDMPWWILEGVAEQSAEKVGARRPESRVLAWARAGDLTPWADLADFDVVPASQHGRVYAQGHHMMAFITDRWGHEGRNRWMTEMAGGKTIDEASRAVMQTDFAGVDRLWREHLDQRIAQARAAEEKEKADKPGGAPPDAPEEAPASKPDR